MARRDGSGAPARARVVARAWVLVARAWVLVALGGCGDDVRELVDAAGADASRPDAGPVVDAAPVDAGTDAGPPPCVPAAPGAWRSAPELPSGRESHAAVVHAGRLFVLGGWTAGGATAETLVADLDGAFAPAAFAPATPLPRPLEHHGVTLLGATLCVVGGDDGALPRAEVSCAEIAAGGTIGAFAEAEPLPEPRTGHALVQVGAHVYVLGGSAAFGGATSAAVFHAVLDDTGRPAGWRRVGPLPVGLDFAAGATDGAHVFVVGGLGRGVSGAVLSARVGAAGELDPFVEVATLPAPLFGAAAVVVSDQLVVTGGLSAAMDPLDVVRAARLDASGAPSAFVDLEPLPAPRYGHALTPTTHSLLATGGWVSRDAPPRPTVFVATLCE